MSTETKKPFVMGFIGRSGSGKTTLAAAVLRILAARGWASVRSRMRIITLISIRRAKTPGAIANPAHRV